jgi:hypothetical protein
MLTEPGMVLTAAGYRVSKVHVTLSRDAASVVPLGVFVGGPDAIA